MDLIYGDLVGWLFAVSDTSLIGFEQHYL
jgi:hypothetical protein